MSLDLSLITQQAIGVVQQAGDFIRAELGKVQQGAIEEKSLNSLVSYVDKTAEKMLVDGLHRILPEAGFITEEDTISSEEHPYQWVIDPLDGTTNFLHQLPCFAVSVALWHQGKGVLGIVLEVSRNELFHAWQGGGAYLNGQPIHVSQAKELGQTLVATGFPYYDFERLQTYLEVFTYFTQNTRGIRRWGAAAVDLAYVACGRYDFFFEYSLQSWDIAAGAVLVQEAGGVVSDFAEGDLYLQGREILAANKTIHQLALPIVAPLHKP